MAAAFAQAFALHQQGALPEAERLYRVVLDCEPGHFAALYRLGLVRAQRGALGDAAELIRSALRRNPASAEAHNDLGAVLKLLDRVDEAIAAFRAALALDPHLAKTHYNLGAALRGQGKLESALEHFRRALAADPRLLEAHNDLAVALASLGRAEEALPHVECSVALDPANVTARINLAKLLEALGRREAALDAFEAALARAPESDELHGWIGALLMQLGRFEEACAAFRKALARRPDFAEVHCNLGAALAGLDRHDEALACFEHALALKPDLSEAHNGLGNARQAAGRPADALACYREALALNPLYADAYNNLGVALAALRRYGDAIACYRAALAIAPRSVDAHNNFGTALTALGQEAAALEWYDKALALAPTHAGALANAGNALKTLGRLDEGRVMLERAITAAPATPRFYFFLSECRRFAAGDPFLDAMAMLARDAAALPAHERVYLHFALAKAYEDIGEHDKAFRQLLDGNRLKRRSIDYDETDKLAGFQRMRAVFTHALMRDRAGLGDPSATPIFIVGMPRSGTTLVEQILASHPRIFGAGELESFPNAMKPLLDARRGADRFPVDVDALQGLAARYLADLARIAPGAMRITDKLPLNFLHVGLIRLALPNARIVHVWRDPLDTCFSCFSKLFAGDQPFAYDLAELGRYYRAYEAVMAHWRAALPQGVMLELRYENVVADLEGSARRLVAHCGLDWDSACLAFHTTARPVRTASVVQVCQPLYRDAVGRADAYRPWLGPLLESLA